MGIGLATNLAALRMEVHRETEGGLLGVEWGILNPAQLYGVRITREPLRYIQVFLFVDADIVWIHKRSTIMNNGCEVIMSKLILISTWSSDHFVVPI